MDVSPDRERGPVGRHRHSPEVDESFHRCSIAGQDVIRQRKRPANGGGRGAQSVQASGRPIMGPGGLVGQPRQTVDVTGPVGIRMSEIVGDDVARTPDCSIPVGVKAVRCTVDTDDVVHDAHLRIGRERGLQSDARAISLVVSAEDGVAVDPQATHLPGNAGAVVVGRHHYFGGAAEGASVADNDVVADRGAGLVLRRDDRYTIVGVVVQVVVLDHRVDGVAVGVQAGAIVAGPPLTVSPGVVPLSGDVLGGVPPSACAVHGVASGGRIRVASRAVAVQIVLAYYDVGRPEDTDSHGVVVMQ